jgi:hypothetical protein
MKGLIVSLAIFVLYVISTMLLAHVLKPKRHSKLFFPAAAAWSPVYFLVYFLTPADLGFLAPAWMAKPLWLDAVYGYVVFLLNAHSYIDFFFGFNGGFSMSLMLELLRSGERGLATANLVGRYRRADGVDTIYGWRLPRLAETGYIAMDPQSGVCRLTGKGRAVARLTWLLKRILNLGAGG